MKKILSMLLVLSMIFALVSCGGEDERVEETTTEKVEVSKNDSDKKEDSKKNESNKKEEGVSMPDEENEEVGESDSDNGSNPSEENRPQNPQQSQQTQRPQEPQQQEPQQPEEDADKSVAYILADAFKANAGSDCITIANTLVSNPVIKFMGGAMEVEEGYLTGFDNTEIKGFKSGAMFAPMIGTIPFVGYVFELENAGDTLAFINTLKSSANLRWNICTAAEEMVAISSGNKVFFVMCPTEFGE